jgi:hypothetical protein
MEEYTTIKNISNTKTQLSAIRLALKKEIFNSEKGFVDHQDEYSLISVPTRQYRSHCADRKRDVIPARDLVYTGWNQVIPDYCEEGWLWGNKDGGMLVCKYNQTEIEYSKFDSVYGTVRSMTAASSTALRNTHILFGGAGSYKEDPEKALCLDKEEEYTFGVSKYAVYKGNWEKGYCLYKEHLEEMGHTLPENFNPPIHWNELYNLGWFGDDNERYTKEQLFDEAELAQDIGAESFYLDPGWDVFPGSTIWDDERFGTLYEFSKTIREKYNLKLALHLMQNFLSDDEDKRFYSTDQDGNNIKFWKLNCVCTNEDWVKEKSRRLLELSKYVDFFMFDFPEYGGDGKKVSCHNPNHGHEVPIMRQTHSENILKVVQNVKKAYPELLIELHDRIDGGPVGYHPMYMQHNLPNSFDELWGYEYMWNPMLDLLSGRGVALYGYNLAYSIPLYLHINEGVDNENMLQFWWYSSLVRHIGIGGVKKGSEKYENLKKAMILYKRLKPYFANGKFYGIDEMAHLHINTENSTGVLTCYNLTSRNTNKTVSIIPEYGIKSKNYCVYNGLGQEILHGEIDSKSCEFSLTLDIPSLSPLIVVFE